MTQPKLQALPDRADKALKALVAVVAMDDGDAALRYAKPLEEVIALVRRMADPDTHARITTAIRNLADDRGDHGIERVADDYASAVLAVLLEGVGNV